ncbi:MAG: NADH-quinone oxidoreductase subunit J [Candidatus Sumerlaeota bacterium]|nr:NADH-quinone oxidoreductase subunit J [Candidatus Sumerlaeota bacterium]
MLANTFTFYVAGLVAVAATALAITGRNAVHALLYFNVSLLATALVFFTFGAPFIAALEVIIYAGAILVLFLFVMMMLNLGSQASEREREWVRPRVWIGPGILAAILLAQLAFALAHGAGQGAGQASIAPKQIALALFGPYVVGVELASMLLLAGLIGAFHLGRREAPASKSLEKGDA